MPEERHFMPEKMTTDSKRWGASTVKHLILSISHKRYNIIVQKVAIKIQQIRSYSTGSPN